MRIIKRALLLGLPNVGKSTLFNRLVGKQIAITHAAPHTTRDVLAAPCNAAGAAVELLDAAGFLVDARDSLEKSIKRGLDAVVSTVDVVILVFDAKVGLSAGDSELVNFARKLKVPLIPVVNKVDGRIRDDAVAEYFALGLPRPPIPVSAITGYNCTALLKAVADILGPGEKRAVGQPATVKVAVVGRPNVGKSSLINKLAGAPRVLVDEKPGTTRDAVDVTMIYGDRHYLFVDTAGIRRRTRPKDAIEKWSAAKALAAIKRADIALLVLDGAEGPTDQDAKIACFAGRQGRGLILFVNKTDLIPGGAPNLDKLCSRIRADLFFASYAPLIAGSALSQLDIGKIFSVLGEVYENYNRQINTAVLNRVVRDALATKTFTARGKLLKVRYVVQTGVAPPVITTFINTSSRPPLEFRRFFENRLRSHFEFTGVPLEFSFRGPTRRPKK